MPGESSGVREICWRNDIGRTPFFVFRVRSDAFERQGEFASGLSSSGSKYLLRRRISEEESKMHWKATVGNRAWIRTHWEIAFCLCLPALLAVAGCRKSRTVSPAESSAVEVTVGSDGTVIAKTNSAQFEILPSGYIRASLPGKNTPETLDDPANTPGESVVVAGQEINDWVLVSKSTKVSNTQGKLGKLGKRIE